MRHVRHRWFWAWDFDKEEDWLNSQAACGLALVDANGFRYVFDEGDPGACEYRMELFEHLPEHPEGRSYLRFLEDAGIECVGSYGRWAYLRRQSDGVPFDLFSDIDSKIAHLRRVRALVSVVLVMQLIGAVNLLMQSDHMRDMLPIAVIGAALAALAAYGFARTTRKLRALKRERAIRE